MRSALAVVTLLAALGCGVGPTAAPVDPGVWLARQGGPAEPDLLPQVEAVVSRLAPLGDGRIRRVLVAATDRVGAWSWPDGTVLLTRAIVQGLDDDEIAAVLAHESGHLAGDASAPAAGHGRGPASVQSLDEPAADRAGVSILAARGIDPAAMPRMLRTIASLVGSETPGGRAALNRAAMLDEGGSDVAARSE